jgi:hypothetical protein
MRSYKGDNERTLQHSLADAGRRNGCGNKREKEARHLWVRGNGTHASLAQYSLRGDVVNPGIIIVCEEVTSAMSAEPLSHQNKKDRYALLYGIEEEEASHLIIGEAYASPRRSVYARSSVRVHSPPSATDTRISIFTSVIDRSHQAAHHRQLFSQTVPFAVARLRLRISFPSSSSPFTCSFSSSAPSSQFNDRTPFSPLQPPQSLSFLGNPAPRIIPITDPPFLTNMCVGFWSLTHPDYALCVTFSPLDHALTIIR